MQRIADMGEGCAEKIDTEFIQYIWRFRKRENEKINRRLSQATEVGKQVIRFTTNAEVDKYLTSLPPDG